ncbi:MAG: hypothetical protein AB9M53_01135 [Leptothrix sp. (in: b-proteobacteria)]
MIDPKTFAANTLQLLQDEPRRYLSFGPYWYLVKAVLKQFYTRENLMLLGDFTDPDVIAAMPVHDKLQDALAGAVEWYRNAEAYGLGRETFETPDGETVTLRDQDAA